jgi:hypothetical protein
MLNTINMDYMEQNRNLKRIVNKQHTPDADLPKIPKVSIFKKEEIQFPSSRKIRLCDAVELRLFQIGDTTYITDDLSQNTVLTKSPIIVDDGFVLGRENIIPDSPIYEFISRQHLNIRINDLGVFIEDTSTNGTIAETENRFNLSIHEFSTLKLDPEQKYYQSSSNPNLKFPVFFDNHDQLDAWVIKIKAEHNLDYFVPSLWQVSDGRIMITKPGILGISRSDLRIISPQTPDATPKSSGFISLDEESEYLSKAPSQSQNTNLEPAKSNLEQIASLEARQHISEFLSFYETNRHIIDQLPANLLENYLYTAFYNNSNQAPENLSAKELQNKSENYSAITNDMESRYGVNIENNLPLTPGVVNNYSQQSVGWSYYHLQSFAVLDQNRMGRFYLNILPEHTPFVAQLLIEKLRVSPHAFDIKFPRTYEESANRSDNIVLYHNDTETDLLINIIENIKTQYPDIFRSETPKFTKSVFTGVGFGQQPKDRNESFGTLRCKMLANVINTARSQSLDIMDNAFDLAAAYTESCKAFGINAENPSFNLDVKSLARPNLLQKLKEKFGIKPISSNNAVKFTRLHPSK